MGYPKKSYLEHIAFRVKDIRWYVRFFEEALGMTVAKVDGSMENPNQVWMLGGLQLIADPDFNDAEGRIGHLAIITEDLELALQEVYAWGATELPKGRNWAVLPDGLVIEFIQAKGDSVEKLLDVEVSYR